MINKQLGGTPLAVLGPTSGPESPDSLPDKKSVAEDGATESGDGAQQAGGLGAGGYDMVPAYMKGGYQGKSPGQLFVE